MLKVISYKDIAANADLFYSQFQLRHREFVDRQQYAVRSYDGMEFDEYDTLASVYLVYSEDDRTVLGCSRLTPISFGCMLADHFPNYVEDKSVFHHPDVWEGTRFCIDRRLPPQKRLLISQQIVRGYIEFGLAKRMDQIIGVMPTLILRSVFERSGVTLDRLGAARPLDDQAKLQAASIRITPDQLRQISDRTGLGPVLYSELNEARRYVTKR